MMYQYCVWRHSTSASGTDNDNWGLTWWLQHVTSPALHAVVCRVCRQYLERRRVWSARGGRGGGAWACCVYLTLLTK